MRALRSAPARVPAAAEPAAYSLEFDPCLVEGAVRTAIDAAPIDRRRRFHEEREPLYDIAHEAERESRFADFNRRWFVKLGLARPIDRLVACERSIRERTARGVLVKVLKAGEEFADLRDDRRGDGRPILLLRLRVTTLVEEGRLIPWLQHELLHVTDMLDPEFGFERQLAAEGGRMLEALLRERYRALWDASVDGRLAARGELSARRERLRRKDFLNTFRMLGDGGAAVFERIFEGPRPTHAEFVGFAAKPGPTARNRSSGHCPLCSMPTARLHPDPVAITSELVGAIRGDFPDWEPAQGLCLQCSDLYSVVNRGSDDLPRRA